MTITRRHVLKTGAAGAAALGFPAVVRAQSDKIRIGHLTPMTGFLGEIWAFLKARKKFWLLPILLVMLMLGGLIVLTQGSAVAPFIYTLF